MLFKTFVKNDNIVNVNFNKIAIKTENFVNLSLNI